MNYLLQQIGGIPGVTIPLISPTISVGMPVTDVFGLPATVFGPPINLTPDSAYGKKKIIFNNGDLNVGVVGNNQQVLNLLRKLSEYKERQQR